ncbi:MAG: S8 family serine peptidase [Acidobacteria bacterium]|nr:S8 family serine peptidase [Acidobacteriota bacterium]
MHFAHGGKASPAFLRSFQAHGLTNVYQATLGEGMDVMAAIEDLRKLPEVEYAEPNYIYRAQVLLNDPYLASQQSWGQPYADLWGLHAISAPAAWNFSTGSGVLVAVIDTGCDIHHPDLATNIWINPGEFPDNGVDDDNNGYIDDINGWNFVHYNNDVQDNYGHGTHIAGIIAASGNNGLGIAGVAWNAKAMVIRAIDDAGQGDNANLANAILYAVENGARVINASWGETNTSQVIEDALSLAVSNNVVVVAAAGNHGGYASGFYPAGSRHVLAVGASDHSDNRSLFSNYGDSLDVLAPGGDSTDGSSDQTYKNILSLRASSITGTYADPILTVAGYYLRQQGTSMAAAQVSGLAALILQRFPAATPEEVRQIIRRSADWIPNALEANKWGGTNGYGRINALKAMNAGSLGSARILSPVPPAIFSAESIPLKITASCADFSRWDLEYFDSAMLPAVIHSSASSQIDHQLPDWNIESVPDGLYSLRLTVANQQGDQFRDQMMVELDRVVLTSPATKSAFRSDQLIHFTGTASGGGFEKYYIRYQEWNSEGWQSDGIALTDGGTGKIRDGVLGTWDTSNIDRAKAFRVQLVVNREGLCDVVEEIVLIVDPMLHSGWPRDIGKKTWQSSGMSFALPYLQHLVAADIDRDGKMEIPIAYDDEVHVLRSDGTPAPGWPKKMSGLYPDLQFQRSPLAADIDGDGNYEIAASARSMQPLLFVWDHKGNMRSGFPRANCELQAISDLNGDGRMEFVCTDWGKLRILNSSGEVRVEVYLREFEIPSAAVADLDGDHRSEIVALLHKGSDNWVYLFNGDGTLRPGWPILLSSNGFIPYLAPVLADLNSDGTLEILCTDGQRVVAYHHNGNEIPGWFMNIPSGYLVTGISAADVTGDDRPEVFVSLLNDLQWGEGYWLLDANGSIMPGWPVETGAQSYGSGSAAIVDLDSDGKRDIIIGSGASPGSQVSFSLHAYRADGMELPGFPKPVSDIDPSSGNTPAVLDIDGDGLLEIAWLNSAGDLYMWDTWIPAQNMGMDWPMSQHDAGHTGALGNIIPSRYRDRLDRPRLRNGSVRRRYSR